MSLYVRIAAATAEKTEDGDTFRDCSAGWKSVSWEAARERWLL